MKRTILVVFLTLASMLLATPSFACGHCDGRFCFIEDSAGDCQLGPHSCTNIVCSGLAEVPAMLSQYDIAGVEVAHGTVAVPLSSQSMTSLSPYPATDAGPPRRSSERGIFDR